MRARLLPSAPLLCLLSALAAQPAWALFDDKEARQWISDLKIKSEARFDQQAKAQLDLAGQIQHQAEEIARLRGQIETLTYELEQARKRQQDFYLDLDSRLRRLEPQNAAPVSAGENPGSPAATQAAPGAESAEYDAALELFKSSKYPAAAKAFKTFVEQHPDSALAPNAQFWLGNSWYAQRNCTKAIEAQSFVLSRYPHSDKAPDALLAIATCQQDLGNPKGANQSWQQLLEKYPNTPAADKARERLKKK
ncbi:tol-pal system protein YbgF [Azonexus sp.]|uniref:tol-pal system protein YbgF n=1 Tax=Azonexus sp. TaxID=1872668 RepID=UPI0039E5209E